MEPGNRDEEGATLPHTRQPPSNDRHSAQYYQYSHPHPDHLASHYPSPDHPGVASYASFNHQSAHANSVTASGPLGEEDTDPDVFYRNYQSPEDLTSDQFMASTTSRLPQKGPGPTGGNGRRPPNSMPRAALRPNMRSASAPVDPNAQPTSRSRAAQAAAGQKPSVKDLKKKFDQHGPSSSSRGPSKSHTTPRIPPRETSLSPSATNYRGVGTTSQTARSPSSTRQSQRARAFPEDTVSNNQQSFASRIAKPPRLSTGAQAEASKSMTNLSPPLSSDLPSPTSPAHQARNLLFGEILPDDTNTGSVGFGIESTRRTSDPDLHAGLRQRNNSHSHEVEPSSPTDWYRGAAAPPVSMQHENHDPHRSKKLAKAHSRAHSSPTRSPVPPSRAPSAFDNRPPQSKLPLPVRKLSSGPPSTANSPPSSRANSPAFARKQPTPDSKPPRSLPIAASKTPTRSRRPGQINTGSTPSSNGRLNAYIAATPPKLSPPLRSSRPRQPVSAATTASSRLRNADKEKAKAPPSLETKIALQQGQTAPRRRKLSMGPIDFESRREQIKLSYTKSIRESEAKEAAKKAAEARKRRLAVEAEAARVKAEAAENMRRQKEEQEKREAEIREEQRRAAELEEAERLDLEQREARREAERLQSEHEEAERHELERLQSQQEDDERRELERLQSEQQEAERRELERLQSEQQEAERRELERLQSEHEAERLLLERLEAERLEAEQQESDRLETERKAALMAAEADVAASEHQQEAAEITVAIEKPPAPALTVTTDLDEPALQHGRPDHPGRSPDSPTLGIPGSFPGMAPAEVEVEVEAPPSAVSNTTEFDVEPQTEPPRQQLEVEAHPTISLSELEPGLKAETDTQLDLQPVEGTQPPAPRSEYKSPFDEDEPESYPPQDGSVPIKFSLEALDATDSAPLADQAGSEHGHDNIQATTGYDYEDDEYQPMPLPATGPSRTTVTIIRRSSGFAVPSAEESPVESRSTHAGLEGLGDRRVDQRTGGFEDGANVDHDQSADLRKMEEYFVGPTMQRDSAVMLADSSNSRTPEASEAAGPEYHRMEHSRFSDDTRRTRATTTSLTVPRTSESVNRTSQATIWTDYSVNSQEAYSTYSEKAGFAQSQQDGAFMDQHSISEAPSRDSQSYARDSRNFPSSPEMSPHDSYRERHGSQGNTYHQQRRLPNVDTGDGFSVEYANNDTGSVVSSIPPSHAPPPPPFAGSTASASHSEYYGGDTRPSSYVHVSRDDHSSLYSDDQSRVASEDFDQTETTHHSIDHGSLEIVEADRPGTFRLDSQQTLAEGLEQSQEAQALSPKERKRLFTRLEIIKELVDTEAFFIRDMNIVEEIYKGTAEACPKLDDNSIKLIFRNTDQIIAFHSAFLAELKAGVASVYTPRSHRSKENANGSDSQSTVSTPAMGHLSDEKDRETRLGPVFLRSMDKMKTAHEAFLKNSDHAAKRLIQIQDDPTVQVWLNECNDVARELTKAWNLDSLLIKPMQRITKYPTLLIQLLSETPADHPDRPSLEECKAELENAIEEINKTKKNFELVGQIVGRKRKESDVKAGLARAFGKRVDKLQSSSNRPAEDPEYSKLHERFGDDYLRLQVVLRDVEFYTRQVTAYVHEFLQYLSSMELVMRLQPSPHPEIESKWVRFNVSMRDVEKVALEQHVSTATPPPIHQNPKLGRSLTWIDNSSRKYGNMS